jgi:uncharacterized membrane protein YqhA
MKTLLEQSKYLTLIAVIACLVASVAAYGVGVWRTVEVVAGFLTNFRGVTYAIVAFIELTDIFLIATSLLIFAVALYELFIGELNLPDWLVVHHFTDLKDKLSGVVVLVMAVSFLKFLLDSKNSASDIFAFGMGTAAVIIALGIYSRLAEISHGRRTGHSTDSAGHEDRH